MNKKVIVILLLGIFSLYASEKFVDIKPVTTFSGYYFFPVTQEHKWDNGNYYYKNYFSVIIFKDNMYEPYKDKVDNSQIKSLGKHYALFVSGITVLSICSSVSFLFAGSSTCYLLYNYIVYQKEWNSFMQSPGFLLLPGLGLGTAIILLFVTLFSLYIGVYNYKLFIKEKLLIIGLLNGIEVTENKDVKIKICITF